MTVSSSSCVINKFDQDFLTWYQAEFGKLEPDFFVPFESEIAETSTSPVQIFSEIVSSSSAPKITSTLKDKEIIPIEDKAIESVATDRRIEPQDQRDDSRRNKRIEHGRNVARTKRTYSQCTRQRVLERPDYYLASNWQTTTRANINAIARGRFEFTSPLPLPVLPKPQPAIRILTPQWPQSHSLGWNTSTLHWGAPVIRA